MYHVPNQQSSSSREQKQMQRKADRTKKVRGVGVELRAGGAIAEKPGWSAGYTAKTEKHEQKQKEKTCGFSQREF